jgi:hypothetical protein
VVPPLDDEGPTLEDVVPPLVAPDTGTLPDPDGAVPLVAAPTDEEPVWLALPLPLPDDEGGAALTPLVAASDVAPEVPEERPTSAEVLDESPWDASGGSLVPPGSAVQDAAKVMARARWAG